MTNKTNGHKYKKAYVCKNTIFLWLLLQSPFYAKYNFKSKIMLNIIFLTIYLKPLTIKSHN